MKFVDEYRFFGKAGNGGDGVVRWRREKFVPKGGPNGGNGGKGGDFIVEAIRDINRLSRISNKVEHEAEKGQDGGSNSKTGRDGQDFILQLPIGSIITNNDTGEIVDLTNDGERVILLKGGAGGLGNEHFKSASNRQPRECTKGAEAASGTFTVELRLIADIGLVGLPNAGKTSLLNALTNADAKVGAYEFTTLDPNLGVTYGIVIADIPGLIEGAHKGRGLGMQFLRHISRTRLILHCISLERVDPVTDYLTVRAELDQFPGVHDIPEQVLLTKSDTVSAETIAHVRQLFAERSMQTLTVSVIDDEQLKNLQDTLVSIVRAS